MAMYHLSGTTIAQIENALELLIDESGHGEIVLPVAHGRLLDYIERRPVIRMMTHRADTGPPGSRAIAGQCQATG